MKTTLTKYNINTSTEAGLAAWLALKETLRATPGRGHRMKCIAHNWHSESKRLPEGEITLDTGHLFGNQWNTEGEGENNGFRVFDWYQTIVPNADIKCGHYLNITDEMIEARDIRHGCGYCGVQVNVPERDFCQHCIGSKYLEEKDLKLLRLRPMTEDTPHNSRPELTLEEEAHLLPAFREAKKAQRLAEFEQRKNTALNNARQAVKDAETEEAATLFLIERDIDPELFIYYSHKKRFCFGWRAPLGPEAKADLLGKLGSEFPYDYDIKQAEAARLS